MNFCAGFADTAWDIALQRQRGTPKSEVTEFYASRRHSKLTLPLVERVYADEQRPPVEYAGAFFDECAYYKAGVGVPRVDSAHQCLVQSLAVGALRVARDNGQSFAEAYAELGKAGAGVEEPTLEAAYASALGVGAIKYQFWVECTRPVAYDLGEKPKYY